MAPLIMDQWERGTLSVKIEMSCVAKMVNGCVLAQADYAHMS